MIGKSCVLILLSSLWITPSFAQAVVGGPKKNESYIGGPVASKNPIVPPRKGDAANTEHSTRRPQKR